MKRINVMEWYKRAAFVYGMSAWTMIGCVVYAFNPELFQFNDGLDPNEVLPDNMEKEIYQWGIITTVVYRRKDIVPPSSRIYNYYKSLTGGSETKAETRADDE